MERRFESFTQELDGKLITIKVYEPTLADYKISAKVKNQTFIEALSSNAPLRAQISTLLRNRGQWDDQREAQYNQYTKDILDRERQLKLGGIKLSKAREIAIEMRELRGKLRELLTDKSSLDGMTAEGQADNANFNALVSCCTMIVNENGAEEKYFKSYEDYLTSYNAVANTAAEKLASLMYNLGDNSEKNLPENKFLIERGFADDKLRLINKEGNLIDSEGRLINEDGKYVDPEGNFVDKFGNKIDNDGEYLVDSKPFLDDENNEIIT